MEYRQGKGGFLEYGHFNKRFMYGVRKNCPAEKSFGAFSPR